MEQISTTSRKLASVQEITDIINHTNSDNLALATVLGWQIIIKRGEFQKGDKIIYFEIDSLLPDKEWSKFMKPRDFKVKTIKLRGEISQGLLLPLSILGEFNPEDYPIGTDITIQLGINKFMVDSDEPVIIKGGACVRTHTFPIQIIEKTDEPRIQSSPSLINEFTGMAYYATLKYDGTSATYLIDDNGEFWICSRNQRREYTVGDVYSTAADVFKIKEKLMNSKTKYAIQCEIYGPNIQKNPLNINKLQIAIFNIKNLDENKHLNYEELIQACKELDLPMVEVIDIGDDFQYSIQDLKIKSKGNYPNTNNPREGLVFRLQKDWHIGKRKSFKIINDDFLIKQK
jgi:RNA ligase (TIGR02306 family)